MPRAVRAPPEYRRLGAAAYSSRDARPATPTRPLRLDRGPFEPLSTRERDIAALTVSGLSYAQMARELFLSTSTIRFHLTNVYAKTGAAGRHALSDLARQHGFTAPLGVAG
jgi:DNA-binding CsgD family transcriptional regulator